MTVHNIMLYTEIAKYWSPEFVLDIGDRHILIVRDGDAWGLVSLQHKGESSEFIRFPTKVDECLYVSYADRYRLAADSAAALVDEAVRHGIITVGSPDHRGLLVQAMMMDNDTMSEENAESVYNAEFCTPLDDAPKISLRVDCRYTSAGTGRMVLEGSEDDVRHFDQFLTALAGQ